MRTRTSQLQGRKRRNFQLEQKTIVLLRCLCVLYKKMYGTRAYSSSCIGSGVLSSTQIPRHAEQYCLSAIWAFFSQVKRAQYKDHSSFYLGYLLSFSIFLVIHIQLSVTPLFPQLTLHLSYSIYHTCHIKFHSGTFASRPNLLYCIPNPIRS